MIWLLCNNNGCSTNIEQQKDTPKVEQKKEDSINGKPKNDENNKTTSNEYFLPDSNNRIYSSSELEKMSNHDLFIARNEIFACHSRGFTNSELASYFGSKSWYHKVYEASEFDSRVYNTLSSVEKKNAEAMLAIEKSRGSSYLNAK